MFSTKPFAEIAALAGNPTRASMLHALLDGRALTASELARLAGIAPQTASGHLSRLAAAGLLIVQKQGRHHYHQLGSRAVAQMIESIMQVASDGCPQPNSRMTRPNDAQLRAARILLRSFGWPARSRPDGCNGPSRLRRTLSRGRTPDAWRCSLSRTNGN